jgi:hypothetical protein
VWLRRLWSGNKVRYQYQLSTYRPWRARSDACEVSFQHHPAYFPLREHHRDDLLAYPAERRFALPIALLCFKEYPSGHTPRIPAIQRRIGLVPLSVGTSCT